MVMHAVLQGGIGDILDLMLANIVHTVVGILAFVLPVLELGAALAYFCPCMLCACTRANPFLFRARVVSKCAFASAVLSGVLVAAAVLGLASNLLSLLLLALAHPHDEASLQIKEESFKANLLSLAAYGLTLRVNSSVCNGAEHVLQALKSAPDPVLTGRYIP